MSQMTQTPRPKPIGITPGRVTDIIVESNDMPRGTLKHEPAKRPRQRPIGHIGTRRGLVCGQH